MTIAIIISPYNAPSPEARAANVRLGIALARWAAAQGYTPVGWWCDVDPANPESDADPVVRAGALARSAERARMVGAAGGIVIMAGWCRQTDGMAADVAAYDEVHGPLCLASEVRLVSLADLIPYLLPEPVPMVPRAAVQAAVDELWACLCVPAKTTSAEDYDDGMYTSLRTVERHTGVTPSEVQ